MANFSPGSDGTGIKSGGSSADLSRDSGTSYSMNLVPGPSGPYQYLEFGVRNFTAVGFRATYRAHMFFNLSGADAGTIESATLKLYAGTADSGGTLNNGHKFYVVGHDYGGSLNAAADDVNPTNNTAGDWTSTSVPTYSSEITVDGVSANDLISVTLNSTAITEINNQLASGNFDIGLSSHYDYKDDITLSPSVAAGSPVNGIYIRSQDYSDSNYRPVLELNYAAPTTGPFKIQVGARVQVSSGKFKVGTI